MPIINPDLKVRLTSAIADHFVMTFVAGIFALPNIVYHIAATDISQFKKGRSEGWPFYFMNAGFALYFCKDCIRGQSIGKWLSKLQVINLRSGGIASPLQCFIRDIFIIIFPIEMVMILINSGRRIGDLAAGTLVLRHDPSLSRDSINYVQVIISFLLSYAFVLAAGRLAS